jgi:hypothetical protein
MRPLRMVRTTANRAGLLLSLQTTCPAIRTVLRLRAGLEALLILGGRAPGLKT